MPTIQPKDTAKIRGDRREFCRTYKNHPFDMTVFTDEVSIQQFSNIVKHLYEIGGKKPVKNRSRRSPTIMYWCMISKRGRFIKRVNGKINAAKYCEILEEAFQHMMNAYGDDDWFMIQDNASVHTAKYTKKFLLDFGIEVLPVTESAVVQKMK